MPATAIAIVCMFSSGVLGTLFPRRRLLIAIIYLVPSMVGCILLWKSDRSSKSALLAGVYIVSLSAGFHHRTSFDIPAAHGRSQSSSFYGALVQMFALLSGNIAGHTKKTVVNATIFVLANLGGFSGPWAYKGNEATQGYPTGQITTLSLLSLSAGAFVVLW
jgi:MFS transporter, ACS family, allantoate permease